MKKIDISEWKKFRIGDLFYRIDPKIKKSNFDKRQDTSTEKTDEFSLPLINAKDGNNGIILKSATIIQYTIKGRFMNR